MQKPQYSQYTCAPRIDLDSSKYSKQISFGKQQVWNELLCSITQRLHTTCYKHVEKFYLNYFRAQLGPLSYLISGTDVYFSNIQHAYPVQGCTRMDIKRSYRVQMYDTLSLPFDAKQEDAAAQRRQALTRDQRLELSPPEEPWWHTAVQKTCEAYGVVNCDYSYRSLYVWYGVVFMSLLRRYHQAHGVDDRHYAVSFLYLTHTMKSSSGLFHGSYYYPAVKRTNISYARKPSFSEVTLPNL